MIEVEEFPICTGCRKFLTEEEEKYYTDKCEQCISIDHDEVQRWRKGENNPELDEKFSAPKKVLH